MGIRGRWATFFFLCGVGEEFLLVLSKISPSPSQFQNVDFVYLSTFLFYIFLPLYYLYINYNFLNSIVFNKLINCIMIFDHKIKKN